MEDTRKTHEPTQYPNLNHRDTEKDEETVDYHQHCALALDGGCEFYFTGTVPIPPLSARHWKEAYLVDSPFERDTCLDFVTPSYIAAFEAGELETFFSVVAFWWRAIFPSDVLKGTPRQIFSRFNGSVEAVERAIRGAGTRDLENHFSAVLFWNARRGVVVRINRRWQEELEYAFGIYHSLHPFRLGTTCRDAKTPPELNQEFADDILCITIELYNSLPSPPPTPSPSDRSYRAFTQMLTRSLPYRPGWRWMPNES